MHRGFRRRDVLGVLGSFGAAVGFLPRSARAADSYTLRMNLPNPAASALGQAGLHLASVVNQRSNGQLKIEVYPSFQLAKEQETIDALTTGVIDLAISNTAFLAQLFPQYQIFDLSFLFKDFAAALRVLDGSIGEELFAQLEPKGIIGLCWGTGGMRQLEATRAVVVPEDAKGLRVRISGGAIYSAVYQALGAIPLIIDGSETLTSLQSKTIDALDVNLDSFTQSKYYVVAKHVAMTNQNISVLPMLGSKRKIEAMPQPLQRMLKEEGKLLNTFWRTTIIRQVAEDVEILKKAGVTFTEVQHAAFRKAVQPAYAMVQARVGGLLDRVIRVAGA